MYFNGVHSQVERGDLIQWDKNAYSIKIIRTVKGRPEVLFWALSGTQMWPETSPKTKDNKGFAPFIRTELDFSNFVSLICIMFQFEYELISDYADPTYKLE